MSRSSLAFTVVASRRVVSINMVWPGAPARGTSLEITLERKNNGQVKSKREKVKKSKLILDFGLPGSNLAAKRRGLDV